MTKKQLKYFFTHKVILLMPNNNDLNKAINRKDFENMTAEELQREVGKYFSDRKKEVDKKKEDGSEKEKDSKKEER